MRIIFVIVIIAGLAVGWAGDQDAQGQVPVAQTAYKLTGWNDLGMHCMDGKDFSIFAVLPPYNTIHAHLMDPTGKLVKTGSGFTVTYQAVTDPLTKTLNTTSASKTNFWQYALKLGFGMLQPDQGLKGYSMPGLNNTPQAMTFSATDNTFTAVGIPLTSYTDTPNGQYPVNYFPMMRLVANDASGAVLATTDIVLPISDELSCNVCHASGTGTPAAEPAAGWVYNPDPLKDTKLNILRKHDDRFKALPLFKNAAKHFGYNPQGLEQTVASTPILCATCHASNALGLAGYPGIQSETSAIHGQHATAIDPATNQTMDSGTTRDTCYRCHPGPNTQCLRGAMGKLVDKTGRHTIECQGCHGPMSKVALASRQGWLDEPACQSCHTGTATHNNGQIVYTSVFTPTGAVRQAIDQTYATNQNTPGPGLDLYRFSSGHGGLQCEGCHNSTHAEYTTVVVNDNVQSTTLQGHVGMLAECTACHNQDPNTVTGGPHGLHPLGQGWVSSHSDAVENSGTAQCQLCHGKTYRGTILSKTKAARNLNIDSGRKTYPAGAVVGCYDCHNGPNGG